MPFRASGIVLFHLFHMGKTFPFEDFLIQGNKKKLLGKKSGEWGGWGTGVMPFFGQKLLNTHACGQVCLGVPHREMGQCVESSKKKFTDTKPSLSQQCQLVL